MMLGRGLVADPSLAAKLQGQPGASRETLKAFVEELFQETAERLGNPRSTMFRMKEIWSFLILLFDDRDKCQKTLRKATSLTEYQAAVERIFQLPLRDAAEVNWV
jgi:tRNA-dihydrouridine synthase